jgi:hypothetical protein
MSLKEKKVEELKEMCKQKKISGYSKLKKEDLIKILSKKKGGKFDKSNVTSGLPQNVREKYSNREDVFIAHASDNEGLFNKENDEYYRWVDTPEGPQRRVFKIFQTHPQDNFTVICQVPGLPYKVRVLVEQVIFVQVDKKLSIVVSGQIIENITK